MPNKLVKVIGESPTYYLSDKDRDSVSRLTVLVHGLFSGNSLRGSQDLNDIQSDKIAYPLSDAISSSIIDRLEDSLQAQVSKNGVRSVIKKLRSRMDDSLRNDIVSARRTVLIQRRPILRGKIDLCAYAPLIERENTPLLYLVVFPVSKKHAVGREIHGHWGYHFHYCDAAGARRSDVLLTFTREDLPKPVMWEPHAVGKADFRANINSWGDEKRSSVHEACVIGKANFALTDFVEPSAKANFLIKVTSSPGSELPGGH